VNKENGGLRAWFIFCVLKARKVTEKRKGSFHRFYVIGAKREKGGSFSFSDRDLMLARGVKEGFLGGPRGMLQDPRINLGKTKEATDNRYSDYV